VDIAQAVFQELVSHQEEHQDEEEEGGLAEGSALEVEDHIARKEPSQEELDTQGIEPAVLLDDGVSHRPRSGHVDEHDEEAQQEQVGKEDEIVHQVVHPREGEAVPEKPRDEEDQGEVLAVPLVE
jgi:hypothetical protein